MSICLIVVPWLLFQRAGGIPSSNPPERLEAMAEFAVLVSCLMGVAVSLWFDFGLIGIDLAKGELPLAGGSPIPCALIVLAAKPLGCIAVLPALPMWVGVFIISWWLPRSASASERILATAQCGASGGAITCLWVLCPFSLALCTVPCIAGLLPQHSASASLRRYLADGNWVSLASEYTIILLLSVAATAVGWAVEAMLHCGWRWLWARLRLVRTENGKA